MSWLKQKVRDWLTRDEIKVGRTAAGYPGDYTLPRGYGGDSFNVGVTAASNGHVLEIMHYNPAKDQHTRLLRICPADTPVVDELAALIAEYKLR